jgi:protein SCO1/2
LQQDRVHTAGKPHFWRRHWFALLAGVIGVAAAGTLLFAYWQSKQIPVIKRMDDFTLEKVDGTPFHLRDTDGKVRLVSFIFTHCPDVCPATTFYMARMQDELKAKGLYGKDVVFLTITFDPERDTPEVLQKYAEQFHADQSGWYFLRGDTAAVAQVTKAFGIGVLKQPDGSYLHTMRTFVLDKERNLRVMHGMGAEMNPDAVTHDLELLADE